MTTLPERPDGEGIDWVRIYIKDDCLMRDNLFWSLEGFADAVAAHTRERCAKLAETHKGYPTTVSEAIREMED